MSTQVLFQDVLQKFATDKEVIETMMYVEDVDVFCRYQTDRGYYEMLRKLECERYARTYLVQNYFKSISGNIIRDFCYQMRLVMPNTIEHLESDYIALKDCLINVTNGETMLFNPKYKVHHHVDIESKDLLKPTPLFTKFLNEILVDNDGVTSPDLIQIVQEMFGFALINNIDSHKVFFLWGNGANGKSVLLHVLTNLIGEKFVTAKSIQSLTTNRFSVAGLVGKKINICNEEESKYIETAKFKALVSGDPVEGEYKYGGEITFKPQVKFIFSTNQMPTFKTLDDALRRRFIIIPFKKKIEEVDQDKSLKQKLLTEIGGIFKWAVEGAMRLIDNGYKFTQSKLTNEMLAQFEEEISSAIYFVRENYIQDDEGFIANEDLYQHYRLWCETNGRKPMNSHNFSTDISGSMKIKTTEPRYLPDKGKTVRGKNLKLIV